MISVGELALPTEMTPWILDKKNLVPHDLLYFKYTIGMVSNKTNVILIRHVTGSDCDEAVIRMVASFDTIPQLVDIDALFVQIVLLWEPPSEDVQILGRITTIEVIASANLQIRLLNQTHPHFTSG